MPRIDVFLTPLSPYAYLGGPRLTAIAARHGAEVRYRPLDAAGLFARTGGTAPKDRHESRKSYRLQDLRRQAARLGMPINLQPAFWPTNPAPAAYAVIAAQAAQDKGAGGDLAGLVQGFARAVWAENRDIADDAVVQDVLRTHGFDPGLSFSGMLLGAETYAANLEEAVNRGVFGVPTCVVGEERFWGQDRLDDLDAFLAGAA